MRPYVFAGGSHVGTLCLLASVAHGHKPDLVIAADRIVAETAESLGVLAVDKVPDVSYTGIDSLLLSVHLREIVKSSILRRFIYKVNLHPCLREFPGADPMGRWLKAKKRPPLTVSVHEITERIDGGRILNTFSRDYGNYDPGPLITEIKSRAEAYLYLYPLYRYATLWVLNNCPPRGDTACTER